MVVPYRALLTESNPGGNGEQFYQPEPTLLTIASGAPPQVSWKPEFRIRVDIDRIRDSYISLKYYFKNKL